MNKVITILVCTFLFCCHTTSLNSQTVTRRIVASFANSENPSADIERVYGLATTNRVSIEQIDKLTCIPNTFLWGLTGSLSGILATVEGIKRPPTGSAPNGGSQGGCGTCARGVVPISTRSPDSLNAYSFCENTASKPVLMAVIDDGIGETFGTERNPVDFKTFFKPYLWSNPSNAVRGSLGSIGYSFLNNNYNPVSPISRHGSVVTYRIVDMLRKANVQNVRIMILQTHNPETGLGTIWNVCRALEFACANNANIINLSAAGLIGNTNTEVLEKDGTNALEVIFDYLGRKKETLIVAAAGNDNQNVSVARADRQRYCTASFKLPNLLEVAANARNSNKLWFVPATRSTPAMGSNYSPTNVHLSAPGEDVYAAVPITVDRGGALLLSGTSLAAPHVSAAAAILATNNRAATFTFTPIVKSILATVTVVSELKGLVSSSGRLNTCKALQYYQANYSGVRGIAPASNTEGGRTFVSRLGDANLDISPNPTQSALTIHVSSHQEAQTELVIQDLLGQVKWRQNWSVTNGDNVQTIDVSTLNNGVYFVNIRIGEQNLVQKLIKNQ